MRVGREWRVVKRFVTVAALCALLACFCALLAGCEKYEPESTNQQAINYYEAKYHEKVTVKDSHGLGNYSLFNYIYGGTEYVMSDGTSVVYIDSEGVFRDNRQSAQIEQAAIAFAEQRLAAIEGAVVPPVVRDVGWVPGYETYEGESTCWETYFDGDIEAFLRAERPWLGLESNASGNSHAEGRFSFDAAYDRSVARAAEQAYFDLSTFFNLNYTTVAIVDGTSFELGATTLFDDALIYTINLSKAADSEDGSSRFVHFKPAFVTLAQDISISSATPGIDLKEGDMRFVERADGFYDLQISGDAAGHSDVGYYVRCDGASGITLVRGIDQFTKVCDAHDHVWTSRLHDGSVYYLGSFASIAPSVEVQSVTGSRIEVVYHTHFKDQISQVKLRVIGLAMKRGGTTYESTEFPSRIVSEVPDGWYCIVEVPEGARADNELHFQFTYDNDDDVTVQIAQKIALPV